MSTRRFALLLAMVLGVATAIGVSGTVRADKIADADQGGRPFATELTGAAEIPGPGDADGSGFALITLNQGQGTVCFELSVENIALPATGAHIHIGTVTESGPVVVRLAPPDELGASSGCVSADPDLIKSIRQNPSGYYVNVHSSEFGAGAVRGQLGK